MTVEEFDSALSELETRVDRLRALYENWFRGYEKTEPAVPRKDVERRVYALRKELPRNTALRFRYHQLYLKYTTMSTYWQRTARQIEEGTYGPQLLRLKRKHERDQQEEQRRERRRHERGKESESEEEEPRAFELDLDESLNVDDLLNDLELEEVARALDRPGPHSEPPPPLKTPPKPAVASFGKSAKTVDSPTAGRPVGQIGTRPASPETGKAPETGTRPGLPAARPGEPLPAGATTSASLGKQPAAATATAGGSGQARPSLPPFSAPLTRPQPGLPPAKPSQTQAAGGAAPKPVAAPAAAVPAPRPAASASPATRPAGSVAHPAPAASARSAAAPQPPAPRPAPEAPVPATVARPAAGAPAPATAPRAAPTAPSGTTLGRPGPVTAPAAPRASSAGSAPRASVPGGGTFVGRPPAASPLPDTGAPDERRLKRIYEEYSAARRRNNEGEVRYEALVGSIQKMLPELSKKHQGKHIDFEVVVKDGRVGLKPKAT